MDEVVRELEEALLLEASASKSGVNSINDDKCTVVRTCDPGPTNSVTQENPWGSGTTHSLSDVSVDVSSIGSFRHDSLPRETSLNFDDLEKVL